MPDSSPFNPVFADFLAGFATSFTCSKTDGSITSRKRAHGLLACTAQIRLMENGTFVHRESQTYRRKVLASEWLRRREYELEQERASGQALHKKVSVGELLRDYVSAAENVTEWGRSKKADIARLQASGRAA
ncbi:hypothetical protein JC796_28275 [Delftia acidovorans]|uniref:hypothetical protein n=2 Tax=Delftia TaxID=80865 RepID=UPI0018E6EE5E|nr:hypothetical protein [Delftia acidovorans]MBJ2144663.1 hypothetical protein [Delftia acidovorans]